MIPTSIYQLSFILRFSVIKEKQIFISFVHKDQNYLWPYVHTAVWTEMASGGNTQLWNISLGQCVDPSWQNRANHSQARLRTSSICLHLLLTHWHSRPVQRENWPLVCSKTFSDLVYEPGEGLCRLVAANLMRCQIDLLKPTYHRGVLCQHRPEGWKAVRQS